MTDPFDVPLEIVPTDRPPRKVENVTRKSEPSPELKSLLKGFVQTQREKHGENWKQILAEEMTAKSMPAINKILDLAKKEPKP